MVCNFNFRLHLEGEALETMEGKDKRIGGNSSNSRYRDTTAKSLKSRNLLDMCVRMIRSQYAGMGKGKEQVASSEGRG